KKNKQTNTTTISKKTTNTHKNKNHYSPNPINYKSFINIIIHDTENSATNTMGSLMAGWDSLILDPESATIERNRSLTKEEINAFWKTKKETELEHLRALSKLSETIR
ncbi:hypothetical protein L3H39_10975, partial [Corynebacterium sp. MC-16]|nr:hypothetical protein [Corynebacterium parakroppenstedtii]